MPFYTIGKSDKKCDYPKCEDNSDYVMPGLGFVVYLCATCLSKTFDDYNSMYEQALDKLGINNDDEEDTNNNAF